MIVIVMSGILAMGAFMMISFPAEAALVLEQSSTHGMLLFLGSGLVALGLWGRMKTPARSKEKNH